jgi:hypothetical protein
LDKVDRMHEREPIGIFVGPQGGVMHQAANGKVRHQQTKNPVSPVRTPCPGDADPHILQILGWLRSLAVSARFAGVESEVVEYVLRLNHEGHEFAFGFGLLLEDGYFETVLSA